MTTEAELKLRLFLEALAQEEEPLGMMYSDEVPATGLSPKAGRLPSADDERERGLDWAALNKGWSCVLGHLRLARKKKIPAYFERDRFGCLGGAFFLGFNKPQLEAVFYYVSTGVPNVMEGERYLSSPEAARKFYTDHDPEPAPKRYCVFKPISQFQPHEAPEFVTFFGRPEMVSGLHQLAVFVTGDPETVASPWGAGCANVVSWPRKYAAEGRPRACLGGWDPSCRKFLKMEELTFTMPTEMYERMLDEWPNSFLTTREWAFVKSRIAQGNPKPETKVSL